MPRDSNRQRGTFRSWVSGCGLRVSASTEPPASRMFAHSLTEAMPAPEHDVAPAGRVLLGLVGLHDPVLDGRIAGAALASTGGKDSGP